jgi:hypothetical protein
MSLRRSTAVAAVAMALATGAAFAGRACDEQPLSARQVEQGMNLAQATARALEASGAQVVMLARAGQDLSSYGLRWSHLGFAYRESGSSAELPRWRVVHKLNHCGTPRADLFRQGLGEFFLDRPHRYEAAFVRLNPELQQALLPLLKDAAKPAAMHEPRYSMVAYAWGTRYQQSNQWALETLALAAEPAHVRNRSSAQAWLKLRGYQPSDLRLSTATRLGARLTRANIAFDDHPSAQRFAGHIETASVDSIFAWLQRAGLGEKPQAVPTYQ